MGFTVFGEDFFQLRIQFTAINLTGAFNHFDTAERNQRTFQWRIGLQTDDLFQFLVDITGIMRGNGGRYIGIEVNRRVSAVFLFDAFHNGIPQFSRCRGSTSQKGFITFIRRIVFLNEVTYVDAILPFAFAKTFPSLGEFLIKFGHITPTFDLDFYNPTLRPTAA